MGRSYSYYVYRYCSSMLSCHCVTPPAEAKFPMGSWKIIFFHKITDILKIIDCNE